MQNSDPPPAASHRLLRELRLPDLVSMQILLVFGGTWVGTAARLGGAHIVYWLAGILLFFIPVAMVVGWCAGHWPEEGGVYQWTKHTLGPFAGFLAAWNFGVYAVLILAALGQQIATTLHYAFGPAAAWMETSPAFGAALSLLLMAALFGVNVLGFRTGKWLAHFGTAMTLLVIALAIALLFIHPAATPAHPYRAPQPPFVFALPAFSLFGFNIFSKLAFYGLSGLEQVAVFAGEMPKPRRDIFRSALIAAPAIAVIYILTTGALLAYTKANDIDLTGPIPQLLGTALAIRGGAGAALTAAVNLAFAAFLIAQYATIIAEASRLPMVAAWDHLIPAAFTALHPRYRTPVLAIGAVCAAAFATTLFASFGASPDEAFQIMTAGCNMGFGSYYLLMFLVPLLAGTRFCRRPHLRAGAVLRLACVSGLTIVAASLAFNLVPIVKVASAGVFALKILALWGGLNALGVALYWRGRRALTPAEAEALT